MKSVRPVLLLAVVPAILLQLAPATHSALLYDRAAILRGEWWRLWTGHWVHFTASHLIWNLLVLAGAGWWLERVRPGSLLRYLAVAAPVLGLSFLAGAPDMSTYGGLSGLGLFPLALLLDQPGEAARQHFPHHGEIVLADVFAADIELAVLRFC